MLFKTTAIASQFRNLHPDLRAVLHVLDAQLEFWKLPPLTVTDAIRTQEEQERIYTPHYLAKGFPEDEARRMARRKFSWHLAGTGADFRSSGQPYSDEEVDQISEWLHVKCSGPEWELLFHDVGHGKHFHVARRCFLWRRKWEQTGRV